MPCIFQVSQAASPDGAEYKIPCGTLVLRTLFLCCARIHPFNPAGSARRADRLCCRVRARGSPAHLGALRIPLLRPRLYYSSTFRIIGESAQGRLVPTHTIVGRSNGRCSLRSRSRVLLHPPLVDCMRLSVCARALYLSPQDHVWLRPKCARTHVLVQTPRV
ncbi:hypothetical protein B0H13DRAFT_866518 [Mycena leptocephala]|nr:hypothetical protein B0H13DRAFT_866518 [Mycena leptocephala]